MDMGTMSMGGGVPTPSEMQKVYWAVVGAAIATATALNIYNKFLCRQRFASNKISREEIKTNPKIKIKCIQPRARDASKAGRKTHHRHSNGDGNIQGTDLRKCFPSTLETASLELAHSWSCTFSISRARASNVTLLLYDESI